MLHAYESNASLQFSTFGNLLSSSTRARMFRGLTAMRSRASWLSTNSMCCQLMPSRLYSCCEHKPPSVCQAYPVTHKPPTVCQAHPVIHKPPSVCQAYPVTHKPPTVCQAYPVTHKPPQVCHICSVYTLVRHQPSQMCQVYPVSVSGLSTSVRHKPQKCQVYTDTMYTNSNTNQYSCIRDTMHIPVRHISHGCAFLPILDLLVASRSETQHPSAPPLLPSPLLCVPLAPLPVHCAGCCVS